MITAKKISIHTPVKGVTRRCLWCRPRTSPISIHTPVKGVTGLTDGDSGAPDISIHTPVKGVTLQGKAPVDLAVDFNPHTREGCDVLQVRDQLRAEISIHTPVKGVTVAQRLKARKQQFQSTHP